MKCPACKYEKRGWKFLVKKKKDKKAGELSDYVELDPEKRNFLRLEGTFVLHNGMAFIDGFSLTVCPKCGNVFAADHLLMER